MQIDDEVVEPCAVQCERKNKCDRETCRTYIKVGAKLRDVKFNNLWCKGLSIFDGDKCVAEGFIGEVLKKVVHLADRKIKSCNYFFDIFVIRLEPKGEN